jgi:hypothetical protein
MTWSLEQPDLLSARLANLRPDFLIISPPKTGSTWLAANLRCHPGLFVPAIKEVKYFSSFFQWFDLAWYLEHFRPAGKRVKGEASPSYAILPVQRIRLLRQLLPDVKLIYLMREPIARAWSHARHNRRYHEGAFSSCGPEAGPVSLPQWQANCIHDWPFASGDYLGQLRRWLSVFPREQVYVDFSESIAQDPAGLLRQLFAFLGVDAGVDLSSFPLQERILPGPEEEFLSSLARFLHRLWHERSVELAPFLEAELDLTLPAEWQTTLAPVPDIGPEEGELPHPWPAFGSQDEDDYLSRVLAQEETFPSAYRAVLGNYRGYEVFFYRGRLIVLTRSLGTPVPLPASEADLVRLQAEGSGFVAPTLAELKDQIAQHVFAQAQVQIRTLEAGLHDAHGLIAHLDGRLGDCLAALREVEGKAFGLSPASSPCWTPFASSAVGPFASGAGWLLLSPERESR